MPVFEPKASGVSDFDPTATDDPQLLYAEYDELRQRCPVARTDAYGGYFLLTRHADIKACANDHELFISSVKAVVPSDPRGLRRPPLNTDPPVHTPFRTALDRTLKPARTRRLAQRLEQRALDELLPILESGQGDLAEFGARFAAWVVSPPCTGTLKIMFANGTEQEVEWLNLDEGVAPVLADTASRWVMAWRDQDVEAVGRYSKILYSIAEQTLKDRETNPRDVDEDPASSLLAEVDEHGDPLDPVQVLGALRQSLVVGMVAPPILIGSIVRHLDSDLSLQDELRNDLSKVPAAVDEFIRLYTPYRGFARTVSREVKIHGQTIKPGQPITMTYASANRDPEVFEAPHRFILNRPNISQHLGFGVGKHRCAGMPLAKLSIEIVLRVLLSNTSYIEVRKEEKLQFARMPELGVTACPVQVTAS